MIHDRVRSTTFTAAETVGEATRGYDAGKKIGGTYTPALGLAACPAPQCPESIAHAERARRCSTQAGRSLSQNTHTKNSSFTTFNSAHRGQRRNTTGWVRPADRTSPALARAPATAPQDSRSGQ